MDTEQAQKCLELGQAAFRACDFEKALRMFTKSNRFRPSTEAVEGIQIAEAALKGSSPRPPPQNPQGETRQQPAPKAEESPEIKAILRTSDYYELLGVTHSVTPEELKKVYRKLALKFHPDKNSSHGATEAFKKITKAYSCLNDPEKRKYYDQTGSEEPQGAQGQPDFYNDVWAEQIFRGFFDTDFDFRDTHTSYVYRRAQPQQRQNNNNGNYWPLIQLLPLFVLFLASTLSSINFTDPDFSLVQNYRFSAPKTTSQHFIPYFVEPSAFNRLSKSDRIDLESRVEREFYYYLQRECSSVQNKRSNLLFKAQRSYGNQAKYYRDAANNVDLTSCERLEKLSG